ncbi:MAG: trypsin-like serine protease [Bacillota bacterium]|nr:trypsin-like serine protease [Bacillota bacterium]
MKKRSILCLLILTVFMIGLASASTLDVDLESLDLVMPTKSLTEDFEQEGEEGTIKVAPVSEQEEITEPAVVSEGFAPNELEKAIIGRDDRVQINAPGQYPFSAIANMKVTGACKCKWECTGFMVSRNFLMTAAHCMICPEHNKWAKKVTFYFGYKSSKNYLYKYTGGWTGLAGTDFPNYRYDNTTMNHDWCYLKLSKNVGDKTGWMGIRFASDSEINSGYFQVAGYRDNKLKMDWGNGYAENINLMTYDADDVQGNSGGPVYDFDNYAVAIIAAESNNPPINIGRRITTTIYKYMVGDGFQ